MIVDLIEALYRLLWGDLFTLPVAGGIGISFMVVLLFAAGIGFTLRTRLLPVRLFRDMIGAVCEKKAGCGRAFLLPDTGHLHRHPGRHGQPCGRGGRCFGGRRGRGVLDVGHRPAGCFHLLCRVHSGAEVPRTGPAVRRLAGRPGLLPSCAGRAQAGQKSSSARCAQRCLQCPV